MLLIVEGLQEFVKGKFEILKELCKYQARKVQVSVESFLLKHKCLTVHLKEKSLKGYFKVKRGVNNSCL